ncbi:DUF803-domain-containing protein [Rickenella mellea]|uniref:DUF803-domain-containing protein n=1 Tax=Rickenella mellea TaxID=50990 RepID=A0A4Y7PPC9_9AGAM|nr:DUF803-domain-containing protein [Rickenella mellea]
MSSTSSATPSASSSTAATSGQPTQYRAVGVVLAIGSGFLIGTSFVLKKKGLLRSQAGHEAGKGVAYLKSVMWWSGMIMMITGELCNFGAYAFVEAILVTPLGALSVVICAILSHFLLKEKLTLFGWIGCVQCILGAVIIALNGPEEQSVSTIKEFKKLFLAPWFLAYGGACIVVALVIIFYFAPRYGKKSMLWYIAVCSLIGGISVSCTQGLGACILTSIRGQNQFKNWFIYFLLAFVTVTLLTEIYYLNVALAMFNTAMVTPTYYVMFTFCTLVTSVILYQGLKASASQIVTIALGFFVICTGIFILQMSKVDPRQLKVDEHTSILLQATRQETKLAGNDNLDEEEKAVEATEEPGMDAVVGRFGGIGGTVVRARRRATITASGAGRSRRGTNQSNVTTESAPAMSPAALEKLRKQLTAEARTNADHTNGNHLSPFFASRSSIGSAGHVNQSDNPNTNTTQPPPPMRPMLSHDRMFVSPVGTPMGELRKTSSIRFREGIPETSEGSNTTPIDGLPSAPSLPAAALVSSSNSHIPVLNLPSPTLHVDNPMNTAAPADTNTENIPSSSPSHDVTKSR